ECIFTSVEQLMALVKGLVAIIDIKEMVPYVEADSDDDIFLNCALNSEAKYVISGDKHLLNLKHVGEILIVSVSEFLEKEDIAHRFGKSA
ncbi:MAG: putative toxin-antitoxin system toxin component, PIN family, partial [bacterium]|nr:putative toxin-antitoxin system toxin component, PIN family [bacterium]